MFIMSKVHTRTFFRAYVWSQTRRSETDYCNIYLGIYDLFIFTKMSPVAFLNHRRQEIQTVSTLSVPDGSL